LAYNAAMFTPWIKRTALKKRSDRGASLVVAGVPVNMIRLLTLSALVVTVGVTAVAFSRAATQPDGGGVPFPASTPKVSPTATPSPSGMPPTPAYAP